MPIRPFKTVPKDVVEWARFLRETDVVPDPGSVGQDEIRDKSVTFGKLQDVQPNRLLGRDTSPAGTVQELQVDGGIEFTGNGIQRSALTGDVVADAGSGTTTIGDKVVSYQKIQDVSETDRLLGRRSSGAGVVEEIVCTSAGRDLLDDVDAGAQRATLGLSQAALKDADNAWSGAQTFDAPVLLPAYVVASLPPAVERGLIYVSDEIGGPVPAFSDGTSWRRVTDRAVVS